MYIVVYSVDLYHTPRPCSHHPISLRVSFGVNASLSPRFDRHPSSYFALLFIVIFPRPFLMSESLLPYYPFFFCSLLRTPDSSVSHPHNSKRGGEDVHTSSVHWHTNQERFASGFLAEMEIKMKMVSSILCAGNPPSSSIQFATFRDS